jgi:DNA-binding NarL/FixJ family response regulator
MQAAVDAAKAEGVSVSSAKRIGKAISNRLRAEYGSEMVYIPAPDRSARNIAIVAGLAAGDAPQEIAARVGVHVTTVRRVRQRTRRSIAPAEWEL